jgi:exodeoxyribonuclease-3
MRIATWNVNSLKARLGKLEEWLCYAQPDVLCLQETKMPDAAFPALAFAALGYESAHHGNGRWNGVAILSRVGIEKARAGFSAELPDAIEECRILTATCGGVRVASVYVPNGRAVGSEQYELKLAWLKRLRDDLAANTTADQAVAVCGDFNVAPEDRDVWDISQFAGATHVSEPERAALRELEDWGLVDAFRLVYPDVDGLYSWWDYRAGDFHKGHGMRIDLALVSRALSGAVRYALIDREARKGMGSDNPPSDHAPLFVDLGI